MTNYTIRSQNSQSRNKNIEYVLMKSYFTSTTIYVFFPILDAKKNKKRKQRPYGEAEAMVLLDGLGPSSWDELLPDLLVLRWACLRREMERISRGILLIK